MNKQSDTIASITLPLAAASAAMTELARGMQEMAYEAARAVAEVFCIETDDRILAALRLYNRRRHVARLLGHNLDAPEWVRRLNDEQVDQFGTGNGRGSGWVRR